MVTALLIFLQASELVLHWGVRKGRRDWILPSRDIWTSKTKQVGDIAVETSFSEAQESVYHEGDQITLQTLELDFEPGVSITGLTFVIRSEDQSAWYRDGRSSISSRF